MNAERTLEPSQLLRELRAARVPLAAAGCVDAMAEIAEIEAALARAARCTYGTCIACGNRIALDRLELLPATPHCFACATNAHDAGHSNEHPTVAYGRVRGDQVRFLTETELGALLSRLLRTVTRHQRTRPQITTERACY